MKWSGDENPYWPWNTKGTRLVQRQDYWENQQQPLSLNEVLRRFEMVMNKWLSKHLEGGKGFGLKLSCEICLKHKWFDDMPIDMVFLVVLHSIIFWKDNTIYASLSIKCLNLIG